jgi:hypothetical protein
MNKPAIAYQFASVPNGKVIITDASWGLKRKDGSPRQDGDVLSLMTDRTFACCPFNAIGENEICTVDGVILTFNVQGTEFIVVPG